MKLEGSIKQVAAIVGCQALALSLMVLGASALAQFYGFQGADALAAVGADPTVADCIAAEDSESTAGSGLSLDFLDLSIGWPRR